MSLNSHKPLIWFFFLTLCTFVFNAPSVSACSCGPTPTVLDSFDHSDVVIIARIISVEKASEDSDGIPYVDGVRSARMVVEKVFKGDVKVRDELVFGQGGGADCIWTFREDSIGDEVLLYLNSPASDSELWYVGGCDRSKGVEGATEDLLYLENMAKLRGKTRISGTLGGWQNPGLDVKGRKVRLIGPEKKSYEVKTDDWGFFEIYDLPPGKYLVEPELPAGWRIDPYWLRYSPSVPHDQEMKSARQVPILLEANKHAAAYILLR